MRLVVHSRACPRVLLQTISYGAIMEPMVKSWTDERLEECFDAVDQRFDGVDKRLDRVDRDIQGLRGEMNTRFDRMDARFDVINERFDKMNADVNARFEKVTERLEAMHRLLVQGGIVLIAALLGLVGTQL
jgi:tetrahydromethanopterin S-methyltransferase subunit G